MAVPKTRDQKISMYMKMTKRELILILMANEQIVRSLEAIVNEPPIIVRKEPWPYTTTTTAPYSVVWGRTPKEGI